MMKLWKLASKRANPANRQVPDSATDVRRNRNLINKYIRRLGCKANLDLSLDSYGFCYIPFKKFLIIIGVPEDGTGMLYFQTMVFDLHSSQGITRMHKKVAALQLAGGKKGSFLSLHGDEVDLSFSTPIHGLKFKDMVDCLEDFMQTAVDRNSDLHSIR
jgi:hypothetical protein